MTWREFRDEVERQMDEQGIDLDDEIWYIDIGESFDGKAVDIEVVWNPGLGIGI